MTTLKLDRESIANAFALMLGVGSADLDVCLHEQFGGIPGERVGSTVAIPGAQLDETLGELPAVIATVSATHVARSFDELFGLDAGVLTPVDEPIVPLGPNSPMKGGGKVFCIWLNHAACEDPEDPAWAMANTLCAELTWLLVGEHDEFPFGPRVSFLAVGFEKSTVVDSAVPAVLAEEFADLAYRRAAELRALLRD